LLRNSAQQLIAQFSRGGVLVASGHSTVGFRLRSIGRGDHLATAVPVMPAGGGHRVTFPRPGVTEWYSNGPLGLEQGFTIGVRPSHRGGTLTLVLTLSGSLHPELTRGAQTIAFERGHRSVVNYTGLRATDASGRVLPAWMELSRSKLLLLHVDDGRARYPVTVDPMIQQAGTTSRYAAAVLNDSPTVYYRLDDPVGSTTATDSSGHGLNGTYAPDAQLGVAGALLSEADNAVTGGRRDVVVSQSGDLLPSGKNSRTLEAWVSYVCCNGAFTLMDYGDIAGGHGFYVNVGDNGNTIVVGDGSSTPPVTANTIGDFQHGWHLVDVTYDGTSGTVEVYQDGQVVGTGTLDLGTGTVTPGQGMRMYANSGGMGLDEAAIYPAALSAERIGAHWSLGASALGLGACAGAPTAPYAKAVLEDSPAGYYRLDELAVEAGDGVAFDSSPNCANAAYEDHPSSAFGALQADPDNGVGASGRSQVLAQSGDGLPSGNSARTLEAWISYVCCNGAFTLMEYGDIAGGHGFFVNVGDNGNTIVVGDGAATVTANTVGDFQHGWHLVDVTYDGNTVEIYQDGQVIGTGTLGAAGTVTPGQGMRMYANSVGMGLDEAAIYPKALSAERIGAHWSLGASALGLGACAAAPTAPYAKAVLADSPAGYYRLDELAAEAGDGVAFDSSPNCANGAYEDHPASVSGALPGDQDAAVAASSRSQVLAQSGDLLPSGKNSRTLEAWVSYVCCNGAFTLMDYGDIAGGHGFYVNVGDNGNTIVVGDGSSTPPVTANTIGDFQHGWHLVDVTYDGTSGTVEVYQDGQVVGTGTLDLGTGTVTPGQGMRMYANSGGMGLDEAAIYPAALAPAKIGVHWSVGQSAHGINSCAATPTAPYAQGVLADSPTIYYRLDELAANPPDVLALDSSGHCANAAYEDYPITTAGATADSDAAVAAGGRSQVLAQSGDGLPSGNSARTLEAWISYVCCNGAFTLMEYGDIAGGHGFFVNVGDNGNTIVVGDGAATVTANTVGDFQHGWHLVDVTYDGNTVEIYQDGQVIGTGTLGAAGTVTPGQGMRMYANSVGMGLDEAAIYPAALTQQQVGARWNDRLLTVPQPVNTALPTITGTPQQGQTLTDSHGSWTNSPTSYTYQWLQCNGSGQICTNISAATNQTYVPTPDDVRHTIEVQETATGAGGTASPAVSGPTSVILPAIPVNMTPPTISGTAQLGLMLTEHHGSWSNNPTNFQIQWLNCGATGAPCNRIANATNQTYVPSTGDVGDELKVEEKASNAGGTSLPADSAATAAVTPAPPINVTPPTISGTAAEGQTLTEQNGTWTNQPTTFAYQWLRCDAAGANCSQIQGATSQTYMPGSGDESATIEVQEKATNQYGQSAPAASMPTAAIPVPIPTNTAPPSITGTVGVGQALTEMHGTWTHSPTSYGYQWQRCDGAGATCVNIPRAQGPAYTPVDADVGHTLVVQETASNSGGTSSPAPSSATAAVPAPPLVANPGENVQTIVNVPVLFDGSGSMPADRITSYHWDFGDSTSADGAGVSHAYTSAGTYTATLTISDGSSSVSRSLTVTVSSPPPQTVLITVQTSGGQPIFGADVAYIAADGSRVAATTGISGVASLAPLPDGSDTVYVYAPGFSPTTIAVTVANGSGNAVVQLQPGQVATTSLSSQQLTEQEIVAAGINPNDPANQVVFSFVVHLAFIPDSGTPTPVSLSGYINSAGSFVGSTGGAGGGGGGISCSSGGCSTPAGTVAPYVVEGHPMLEWLIFGGQASFLKQFFRLTLLVQNLSPAPYSLEAGQGRLTLPDGISLAPTATPQSLSQPIDAIPADGTASATWIVRGDAPGSYQPSAEYVSTLDPVGAPIDLIATLQDPLQVFGASALKLTVDADDHATDRYPYHFRIGLTNTAASPVYNVQVKLDPKLHFNFLYQPQERYTRQLDSIAPGQTVYTDDFILAPQITGTLDVSQSFVVDAAGEQNTSATITGHPPVESPDSAPAINAGTVDGQIQLSWAPVAGATEYRVFVTPDRNTPFGAPIATADPSQLDSSTNMINVSVNAPIGQERWYAVSSVINGIPTLVHPILPATLTPTPPQVTTKPATNVLPTSATLNGTVDPSGGTLTNCHFDFGANTSYGTTLPCAQNTVSGAATDESVPVGQLTQGKTYHFRLAAVSGGTAINGGDLSFTTPVPGKPTVITGVADSLTNTSATLHGTVTPNGYAVTNCHFDYGIGTFAQSAPCGQAPAGTGYGPEDVAAHLAGLTPESDYQFRLVATNGAGTAMGLKGTFSTCDASKLQFGNVEAFGCFKSEGHSTWRSTGELTVNGLQFKPASGASVTLTLAGAGQPPDASQPGIIPAASGAALEATGSGLIRIGGLIPFPWLGKLRLDLAANFTFATPSGKTGNLFGFGIGPNLSGQIPEKGTVELSTSTSMNVLGRPIQASVGIVVDNSDTCDQSQTGCARFVGADVGVGPASADPMDPSTLGFCSPKTTYPNGWTCGEATSASGQPYCCRLSGKSAPPSGVDWHLIPRCSPSESPPLGYTCQAVTNRSGTGSVNRLLPVNPGIVSFGPLTLESFDLSYDAGRSTWGGEAAIALGGALAGQPWVAGADAAKQLSIGGQLQTNPVQVKEFDAALSNTTIPIFGIAELDGFSFKYKAHPFSLGGQLSLTAGPEHTIAIDGGLTFTLGKTSGFEVKLNGHVQLENQLGFGGYVDVDLRDGGVRFLLGGNVSKSWGPVSATLSIGGGAAFNPFHFQLTGDGSITAFGFATVSAHGIVSDAGIGACGEVNVFLFHQEVGFTHFWGGETDFNGCTFTGLYTVGTPPGSASDAAVGRSVMLPAGLPREEFAVVGANGPPDVTLIGPHGFELSTPATADYMTFASGSMELAVSSSKTTYFIVTRPAAGRWRLVPTPGSTQPVRYELADPLKPLRLRATVVGSGRRRMLRWSFAPQHGVTVRLEQTGGTTETLLTTASRRGQTRFTVTPGPGGARHIVAVVLVDGFPQSQLTAARFTAPAPKLPAVTAASYRLRGTRMAVKWVGVRGAASYLIAVSTSMGGIATERNGTGRGALFFVRAHARILGVTITTTNLIGTGPPVPALRR
jgi:hypothetical protein